MEECPLCLIRLCKGVPSSQNLSYWWGLFPSLSPNTILSSFSWYKAVFNVLACGQVFIYFDYYMFFFSFVCVGVGLIVQMWRPKDVLQNGLSTSVM